MTKLEINKINDGFYRFRYRIPVQTNQPILTGNFHMNYESCKREVEDARKNISVMSNYAVTSNRNGYRFTVFSTDGKPLAYSCYFQTQKRMNRILSFIRQYFSRVPVSKRNTPSPSQPAP